MPRLSLWRPEYSKDYYWIDRSSREYFMIGGVGIYVHKYLGVVTDARDSTGPATPANGEPSITGIQDLLLMENRDRKYDKNVYELRGIYNPNDTDFDLSQFGLFLSNDNLFVSFHINDMVERLGRTLMNGDVLEFPNLKDPFAIHDVAKALKRFYVVNDTSRSAEGFSPTWYPHIWRAKVGPLVDAQEYKDIFGNGQNPNDLLNYLSNYNKVKAVNDAVVAQAEADVPQSGYDTTMFWVNPTNADGSINVTNELDIAAEDSQTLAIEGAGYGTPRANGYTTTYLMGDGEAPNGVVSGFGTAFPTSPSSGDYFKRTDFLPARLFRYDGYRWMFIEDAVRTNISNTDTKNTLKGTFINNTNVTETSRGNVNERQTLNDLLKPKAD